MNKRRRQGRGAPEIRAYRQVKDTKYTFHQFKAEQNAIYERRLREWGFDFEEDVERD